MTKSKLMSLALFILCLLWASLAQAQESGNASSGDATGSGGTVSYSVGQTVYTTQIGTSGSVAQGVQHAYEVFIIGIEETGLYISLSAFPNPTIDNLTLQTSNHNNQKLYYILFDIQGNLLKREKIISERTQIDMSTLSIGTYYLSVTNQENNNIQSFKILKIQ